MPTNHYELHVKQSVPWSEINDYEGQMEVVIPDLSEQVLCVYALLSGSKEWAQMKGVLHAELWLERTGKVEAASLDMLPGLHQIGDVIYEATGLIRNASPEEFALEVAPGFVLRVDLDPSDRLAVPLPELSVGQYARVIGKLQVEPDLHP